MSCAIPASFESLMSSLQDEPGVLVLDGPMDDDAARRALEVDGVAMAVESVAGARGDLLRVLCCFGALPDGACTEILRRLLEVNFMMAAGPRPAHLGIDPASGRVFYLFDAPRWQVSAPSLLSALRASAAEAKSWQASCWCDPSSMPGADHMSV
jgi:hypothetical protein